MQKRDTFMHQGRLELY